MIDIMELVKVARFNIGPYNYVSIRFVYTKSKVNGQERVKPK